MTTPTPRTELDFAILFHETYERLASSFDYETRPDTRAFDPESKNGRLMVAVMREVAMPLQRELAAAQEARQRAIECAAMLYDKWENGDPCHEGDGDEIGASLGNAFRLSADEENAVLSIIKAVPNDPNPLATLIDRAKRAEELAEQNARAVEELRNIVNADPRDWDDPNPQSFVDWAKSRARHTLAAIDAAMKEKA